MNYFYPNQRQINTLHDQKLLESDPIFGIDSGSPPQEYLSEVLNNYFISFLPQNENSCVFNGLDIDVVASIVGFESSREMVEEFIKAPKKEDKTVKPPSQGEINGLVLRDDYLDDLFLNGG